MSELKIYLEECKKSYYKGEPIISDSQFDALEDACSEDLTVGTNKGRFKHLYRMYSLQKYYTDEPLPSNLNSYYKTPKLDGAAIALIYINGDLDSVVTRGDGTYGEEITHLFSDADKISKMGIPYGVSHTGLFQVTGEIVAKKTIQNARNYAAGALNLKHVWEFGEKEITFFAYSMQEPISILYENTLKKLEDMGFKTIKHESISFYPQDGKVYRLNSNPEFETQGYTNKHPRGAFALKERSEGVLTTLLRVEWETGKSGKVTPVAILDPVNIDGAKVSRATLNNPGFIKALDLHIGDAVMVERAGGIIPRIIKKAESHEIGQQRKNSS